MSLRRRFAREGGDGLGGAPRRGQNSRLSALGSLSYAADKAAQHCRTHRQILRQTLGRAKPSRALRTILRNASPSRSGPRFDKRGEVRSPSQPIFLKVWLSIYEAYPGPILHAQPNPPRKSHRALAPPPAAAETLPAVAPALGCRMRHVADLVPTSPAGRNPDPFPHAMPFRTAIDRDPRCS